MLSVAMYLRISRKEKQKLVDESNSIQNQRKMLKAYLMKEKSLNQYPVMEYCDDGYSGTHFERPDVQRLLEDIRQHKIGAVIVKDFSRFSRDYIELGTFRDMIFPMNNVRFISVKDSYDSSAEASGMLDTAVSSLIYDLYSKDLSEKVKNIYRIKCQNGEYPFGAIPLGYERDKKEKGGLRESPEEASIVRRIFSEAYRGTGTCQIARKLNEDGIPTYTQIRGRRLRTKERINWTSSGVRYILKNRFYIGEAVYNKTVREIGDRKYKKRPREEWIIMKDHHKGLVSKEVFDAVQVYGKIPVQKKEKHPLSGKIFCGGCGHPMIFKRKKNVEAVECWNSIYVSDKECCTYFRTDVLEELVLCRLNQELLLWADQAGLQAARYHVILKKKRMMEEEILLLSKEIGLLQEKKRSDYEAYVCKELDKNTFLEETAETARRIEALNEKYTQLNQKKEQLEAVQKGIDPEIGDILKEMNTAVLSQETADFFIEKIILYRDKRVEIFWKFTPVCQPEDKGRQMSG